jgi:class 3 adenylate cyclase/pimeloyl-ACP methyl ester carboxylesterase
MAVPVRPETRYAKTGSVHIAYQVVGDAPLDLILVPGFVSNVEHLWEIPVVAEIFDRLASFSRLILWDKRGTGLSDPVASVPSLDERMDDLCAVMDATGSRSAAFFGVSEGGPLSVLFAATYPERTRALALYGTTPRFSFSDDFETGWPPEQLSDWLEQVDEGWGSGVLLENFAPSIADDSAMRSVWARYQRAGASPAMARATLQALAEIDVRPILSSVRAPTLIIHRTGELIASVSGARYMAEMISGARLVELPGDDHLPFVGDWKAIVDEVEEFLTGAREAAVTSRVLATVMYTDIVGSTEQAVTLGDRDWRSLLDRHDAAVRRQLERYRGREVKQTGDGFLAVFDGPARAVECASAVTEAVRPLGIEVRVGIHTGECEKRGDDIGGIATHIGARVSALARAGEVLVSRTVVDLVAGSGLRFVDRGSHELKGVPGDWQLFAAAN